VRINIRRFIRINRIHKINKMDFTIDKRRGLLYKKRID
jgi:hypothetical protein